MHRSPILWQSHAAIVTLIDIPQSIASAQETAESLFPYHLLSTTPLSVPFPDNEPKSAKARARLNERGVCDDASGALHKHHVQLFEDALNQIRAEHEGAWCLPRPFVEDEARSRKRRRVNDDEREDFLPDQDVRASDVLPPGLLSKVARNEIGFSLSTQHTLSSNDSEHSIPDEQQSLDLFESSSSSDHSILCLTTMSSPSNQFQAHNFYIPPTSTFSLSDCTNNPFDFHPSYRYQSLEERQLFNFILLDPPWPNRSVRRTHKTPGSTYSTLPTIGSIRSMITDMQLGSLMANDCLVGIWITNKSSIREMVLGESGLFDCWGVELVEEWLWLKTTIEGLPILPCDAVVKKPYEVLLLGRKRRRGDESPSRTPAPVKNRVIIAVPDLHSRKPCLKQLIEPLLSDAKIYRALEVFARYLVAGWCSWGDECIKFNWEGYWKKQEAS